MRLLKIARKVTQYLRSFLGVSFHVNCLVSEGASRTRNADEKINLISCFDAVSVDATQKYFFIMQTDVFIEKVASPLHDISIHVPNYWVNEERETEIDIAHKSSTETLVYWENKVSNKFLAEIYSRIETEARSDGEVKIFSPNLARK